MVGACTGKSAGFSPLRMRSTYPAACRYWSSRSDPYEIRPPLSTWFAGNKLRAVYAVPRAPHGGLEVHSSLLNVVLHD